MQEIADDTPAERTEVYSAFIRVDWATPLSLAAKSGHKLTWCPVDEDRNPLREH
jgi:hypothetical protein